MKSYRKMIKKNKTKKNKKHYKGGGVNKSRRSNKGNGAAPKKSSSITTPQSLHTTNVEMHADESSRWDTGVLSNQHDPMQFREGNTRLSNEYTCPKCGSDNLICTRNMKRLNVNCQCQICLHVWFPNK